MKNRHVIREFQAWNDGRIGDAKRQEIQLHLDECDDCRRYFEKMTALLEGIDPALLPRIEPDPFLPARIRAVAASGARPARKAHRSAAARPPLGRLGWSMMAASALVAVAIGTLLGSGWSRTLEEQEQAADAAIVEAYYEVFSPPGIAGDWQYIMESDEEGNS